MVNNRMLLYGNIAVYGAMTALLLGADALAPVMFALLAIATAIYHKEADSDQQQ